MTTHFHQIIAKELRLADEQVARTIQLLEEGATIPFISRYRKERTGGLDEIQIGAIQERLEQLKELENASATPGARLRSRISISPSGPNGRRAPRSPASGGSSPWRK